MKIIIEDIKKRTCSNGTYVGTFSTKEYRTKTFNKYPMETNPSDAERMLQILIMMCHHPEVYAYFRQHIPSPFFVQNDLRDQYIPLNPLLNYLAGPSKISCLDWKEDLVEYSKSTRGVAVRRFFKGYIFPYDNKFASTFLNYFGMHRWEDTDYRKTLTGWDFCNADKDLSICLSNFTTWFISSERYDRLCMDLKDICTTLERMLDQTFFKWNDTLQRETNLVHIMKQRSDFRY